MGDRYSKKCGKELNGENFCPNCGNPIGGREDIFNQNTIHNQYVESQYVNQNQREKAKLEVLRMILGIISCSLFFVISFQSCAVGVANTIAVNGKFSGSAGFVSAILIATAGIIGITTRKSNKKVANFIACGIYWFVFFLSRMLSGNYSDLRIWGLIVFLFGCVFLFAPLKSKKENIIGIVVAGIYFVLGII